MFVNMSAAALVAVIVTPSSCAPDVFVTVPVMFPLIVVGVSTKSAIAISVAFTSMFVIVSV